MSARIFSELGRRIKKNQMFIEEPFLEARNPQEVLGSQDEDSNIEAEDTRQKGDVSDPVVRHLATTCCGRPWQSKYSALGKNQAVNSLSQTDTGGCRLRGGGQVDPYEG